MELAGITGGGNFQRSKKFLSAYRLTIHEEKVLLPL